MHLRKDCFALPSNKMKALFSGHGFEHWGDGIGLRQEFIDAVVRVAVDDSKGAMVNAREKSRPLVMRNLAVRLC